MRVLTTGAVMLAAALLAAGCGGDGGGDAGGGGGDIDVAKARSLFTEKCASCHTFEDADATGTIGPNLDEATLDAESVARQIEVGGGAMPPNLLEGEEKELVAEYVAQFAAH